MLMSLQPLEARRLLSASASIINGVLTITGTGGDDQIFVRGQEVMIHYAPGFTGPGMRFQAGVSVNDVSLGDFDLDAFTSIVINADAGDDRVRVYSNGQPLPDDPEFVPLGLMKLLPLTIEGGAGNDTLEGTGGADTLIGGGGNDLLVGGDGADLLSGGAGNDKINGCDGDDTLVGGAGKDGLNGGASGADVFIGGAGSDTADYSDRTDGVIITLDGVANDGNVGEVPGGVRLAVYIDPALYERDNVSTDVENVLGSSGGDHIEGDDDANILVGGSGDDRLIGHGGHDSLYGHAGSDRFDGGLGADLIVGGSHAAHNQGDLGGDGVDYEDRTEDLSLSLDGIANDGAAGEGDQLLEIENIFSGKGNDLIIGSDEDNRLFGREGADTIRGAGGDDELNGDVDLMNAFDDLLEGGRGNDSLIAGNGMNTLLGGAGRDVINADQYGHDLVDGGPDHDRGAVDEADDVMSMEELV